MSTATEDSCLSFSGGSLFQSSSVFASVSLRLSTSRRSDNPHHQQHQEQQLQQQQRFQEKQQQMFQGHADVHKKPSRSFDLRRLFPFSYGKSKRSKETGGVIDPTDGRPYLNNAFVEERLVDADLAALVSCPEHVDPNEWIATQTLSFVENVNLIYGCLADYCLPSVCMTMLGPGNVTYQWVDDRNRKIKCSAPQYIDCVLSYAHKCVYDEAVFPTKYGNVFPGSFEATVRRILRLLLHVIAHIYQCHSAQVQALRLLDCLNTVSYHFLLFTKRFRLVDQLELEVLDDLYCRLRCRAELRTSAQLVLNNSRTDDVSTGCVTSLAGERNALDESDVGSERWCSDENKENVGNDNGMGMSIDACKATA